MARSVLNVHERTTNGPWARAAELIGALGGPGDEVWPSDRWPRLVLDDGVRAGSRGGHGPIRYHVTASGPGHVCFTFDAALGMRGTHEFTIGEHAGGGVQWTHTLRGEASLLTRAAVLPLHDALLEDLLDRAEAIMADRRMTPRRHPARVRSLLAVVGTVSASLSRVDGEAADSRARRWPLAAATAVALGGAGALHVAWGNGSTWPCADERSLVRHVVGTADGSRSPSPAACHAVAVALAVTAIAALGRQSDRCAVRRPAHVLSRGAASVLALRGVAGAAQSALAPASVTAEYRRLDLRVYSPLCLVLAASLIGLGGAPGWFRRRGR